MTDDHDMTTAADSGIRRIPALRVWLVGSMGSGKSAVGAVLAEALGWPLLDNDAELARMTGRSLADFAEASVDQLHSHESVQLRAASRRPAPFVAGVAASVATRPLDLELLTRTGYVVYLRARPATLATRIGPGEGRPWLDEDALGWLSTRLAEREGAYVETADLVLDVDDLEPEPCAAAIIAQLQKRVRL